MLTHLVCIRALSLLAYNYAAADLDHLNANPDFAYQHREKYALTSDNFLWLFYDLPAASQEFVLQYALDRYGEAAMRQIRNSQAAR